MINNILTSLKIKYREKKIKNIILYFCEIKGHTFNLYIKDNQIRIWSFIKTEPGKEVLDKLKKAIGPDAVAGAKVTDEVYYDFYVLQNDYSEPQVRKLIKAFSEIIANDIQS